MPFHPSASIPALVRAAADRAMLAPTPIQARAIPADPAGARRAGLGPDRLRQDRRLRAAPAAAPGSAAPRTAPRRAARAGARAHARAGGAGRRSRCAAWRSTCRSRSKIAVVFGGVSINPQMMALRGGADIVVATPGRLLDLVEHNALQLVAGGDAGARRGRPPARPRLRRGARRASWRCCRAQRQNLLFSATFPPAVQALADSLLRDPVRVDVRRRAEPTSPPSCSARSRSTPAGAPQLLRHLLQGQRLDARAGVRRHQARGRARGRQAAQGRHRRRALPRRAEPGRAHAGAGRLQGRRGCRCWSPPTWPRAASTSRSCRWW